MIPEITPENSFLNENNVNGLRIYEEKTLDAQIFRDYLNPEDPGFIDFEINPLFPDIKSPYSPYTFVDGRYLQLCENVEADTMG